MSQYKIDKGLQRGGLTSSKHSAPWSVSDSHLYLTSQIFAGANGLNLKTEKFYPPRWRMGGRGKPGRPCLTQGPPLFLLQAYRLEPLILKHYSNISPVQIHWYNTANPLPYEHMKPSFLNPTKEPTSVSESESAPTIPSPTTSPVMARRHYGESITNIGKASILGNYFRFP